MKKKLLLITIILLSLSGLALASPEKRSETVVKGCEPFDKKGDNKKAVLLLHGLGGCPHEVRELSDFLHRNNYTVLGIRYPGHGIEEKTKGKYTWEDWYSKAKESYLNLRKDYETVYIAGFSTGGTLTLKLAEEFEPDKITLLSPFIYVAHKWYYGFTPEVYVNTIGKLIDSIPRELSVVHVNNKKALDNYVAGKYFSFSETRSALKLIDLVKKDIKKVSSPTLLIHSKNDETTDFKSSLFIKNNVSSKDKKLIELEKSNHLITLDYEKKEVFNHVLDFFEK